jgi:hypothetical protein
MRIFFYGLFMDERLLAKRGIKPSGMKTGFVDGYELRIGERATLITRPGSRAYGVVMDILPGEAAELYAQESVADYLPEPVIVELMDGMQVKATCYNLPNDKSARASKAYARSLLEVATRLGFPDSYLDQIRQVQAAIR